MVGVIERNEGRSEPEAIPRDRSRRWMWWVGGGLAVSAIVVWAAVWIGANVVYYQPLSLGGMVVRSNDSSVAISLPGDEDAQIIPVEPGGEFTIWAHMWNTGDRAVRIESVEPQNVYSLFVPVGAVMGAGSADDLSGSWPRSFVPFEPVTLEPGEFVVVGNRHRFHDCLAVDSDVTPVADRPLGDLQLGASTFWAHQTVHFSVGGYGRSTTLPVHPRPIVSWDMPEGFDEDPNQCPAAGDTS